MNEPLNVHVQQFLTQQDCDSKDIALYILQTCIKYLAFESIDDAMLFTYFTFPNPFDEQDLRLYTWTSRFQQAYQRRYHSLRDSKSLFDRDLDLTCATEDLANAMAKCLDETKLHFLNLFDPVPINHTQT